jgi:hypothetical protein
MKLPKIFSKFDLNQFPTTFNWSQKPQTDTKTHLLESTHPNQPDKMLYESQLHPSVFQDNLTVDHPGSHFDKAVFSWIAPEYLQHPKSLNWWILAGVVLVICLVLEAFSGNWSMLAATLTFGVVYWYLHEHHPPKHTKINISELGIKIGHRTIAYSQIEAFWIIFNPPLTKRLCFRLTDKILPDLVIELEHQDPQALKIFLEQHLTEITGVREHLSDLILKILKI